MRAIYTNNGEYCIEIKYCAELERHLSVMFPYEKHTKMQYPLVGCIFVDFSSGLYSINYLDDCLYTTLELNKIPVILMNLLDRILQANSAHIVMHGAAFTRNGSAIILSQGRYSGKSTLLYHMVNKSNIQYIDDDILFVNESNMVIGPSFPIKMRSSITNQTLQAYDDCENEIYLYSPPNVVDNFTPIKFIVFPKYKINQKNELTVLKGKKKVEMFIENMKSQFFSLNKFDCFSFIQGIPAFEIKYNTTEVAEQFLNEIEDILQS